MAGGNQLRLGYSNEANSFINGSSIDRLYTAKQPADVEAKAKAEVIRLGGSPNDRTDLLGQLEVQFGRFKGKMFMWLLENGRGYSAWFVNSMSNETATSAPLSVNKHAFKEYLNSCAEGKEALAQKAAEKARKQNCATGSTTCLTTSNRRSVASLFNRSSLSPQTIARRLQTSNKTRQPDVKYTTGKNNFVYNIRHYDRIGYQFICDRSVHYTIQ